MEKREAGLGLQETEANLPREQVLQYPLVGFKWYLGLLQALCIRENFVGAREWLHYAQIPHDGGTNPEQGSSDQDLE